MYRIKEKYQNKKENKQFSKFIKEYNIKQKEIAEKIGINQKYMYQISNGRDVSKLCAYAICKAISSDLEIKNLFDIM